MRILIVGAGAVGSNLAHTLSQDGHDVTVVDQQAEVCKRLGEKLDGLVVQGNGASPVTLERANIKDTELVIAVTTSDELNMIVCLLAQKYGVKHRIARIRNSEYGEPSSILTHEQLAITRAINPEIVTINTIERLIFTPGATEVADFAGGSVMLIGFLVPEEAPMVGRTLRDIAEIVPDEFLIVAINREGEVLIPRGAEVIKAEDRIYVMLPRDLLELFLGQLYRRIEKVRKVILCGATRMGIMLAERLSKRIRDVVLLDHDQNRCVEAASRLSGVTVLRGSGTDPDMIEELGLPHAQAFVSLLDDDAANVMSALLAKDHEVRKTIVCIGEPEFVPIVERIGLDAAINPRLLAASEIVRIVRAGKILSVAHLGELDAEVMEFVPSEGSAIVNKPLSEMASVIPRGAIIGAIMDGDKMTIPRGNSIIRPGQRVIVFSKEDCLKSVEHLFIGE